MLNCVPQQGFSLAQSTYLWQVLLVGGPMLEYVRTFRRCLMSLCRHHFYLPAQLTEAFR